ncbi:hypothetical protein FOMPIDRAFT_1048345, partial [Fomitopsis schrenkii]
MSTTKIPSATELQAQITALSGQLEAALAAPESERQAARQAVVDVIMPFWPRMQSAAKAKVPMRLPPLLASACARLAVHGREFTLAMVSVEDDLPGKRFSKHLLGNIPYTVAPQGWWKGEHKKRPRSPAPPASGSEGLGEVPAPKRPKKVVKAAPVAPAATMPQSATGATLPDAAAKKVQDDASRKGDEAKKRKAQVKRKAEAAQREADEAKQREADEAKQREAEAKQRKAMEAKQREAEEAQRKAKEAKAREAEEAKRKADEAAALELQTKAREAQAALAEAEEKARQRATEARKAADLAKEKSAQAKKDAAARKQVEAAGTTVKGKGPEPAKVANPVGQTKATTGRGKKPAPKSRELISTSEEDEDEVEEDEVEEDEDEDERPLALARRRKSLQSPRVKADHGDPTQPPFRCDLCIKKDVPCIFSEWRARCDFCTKQKFGCSLVPRFVENGQPLKGAAASDKGDEFRRWVSDLIEAGEKYPEVPIMTGDEDKFLQDLATLPDTPEAHESLRKWLQARIAWSETGTKTACPKPPTARGRGMAQDAEAKRQSKAKSRAKAAAAKARAKTTSSKPAKALPVSAPRPAPTREAEDVEDVAKDEELVQEERDIAQEMAEVEVPEGYDDLFAENAAEADDEHEEDEDDEDDEEENRGRQRTGNVPRVSFRFQRDSQSEMDDAVAEHRLSVKAAMKGRNPNDLPAPNFRDLDINIGLDDESWGAGSPHPWGARSPSWGQELNEVVHRLEALEARHRTPEDPIPEIMDRLRALETRPGIGVQEDPIPTMLARLEALEGAEPDQNARLDAVLQRLAMLERNVGDTEALLHEYDRRMQLMAKAQIDSLQKSFQAALERLAASSADQRPSLETGVQTNSAHV